MALLRVLLVVAVPLTAIPQMAWAQAARISEEIRTLTTYPFSEPNPIPILTRDTRLYPYHAFQGYAHEGVPREWKVVKLENDLIEVYVLPEVGGKVWGAVVKRNGHEFIYRNEVMKFRNIALRGPWTSGGIEFNFGVIGHTPATATPVDYVIRENPDGSVSCFVGAMDLPSRTHWRVEIRLPADRAYFETNVLWYNPTPLEQPYYNWMTAAAFARDDLVMAIPGNAYLEHPGGRRDWPVDPAGRYLPEYANNTFAGHKSYHVVGELNDFFGGYYRDDDYGFGHWAPYEEMPGQKLWLWALSRQGGVWEELLTDTDGQYVEYQAGRLLVQYSPGADVNPITQAGFDPGAADRWSETWFPVEGLGGLSDVSRDGVMYVRHEDDRLTVAVHALRDTADTMIVTAAGRVVAAVPMGLVALDPVERTFDVPTEAGFRVRLPNLGLDYTSDDGDRTLARPFVTDSSARALTPAADRYAFEADQLAKGRRYPEARAMFARALAEEPWHRDALLGLADLEYRRARYDVGLALANRALQLDAYDAEANFVAGNHYRALGSIADAREAYGWSARSIGYRAASYVQLAEILLATGAPAEAQRYAELALDYDRYNLPARQVLMMVGRATGDHEMRAAVREQMEEIDPLHHFLAAESYFDSPFPESQRSFANTMRSEYPDQVVLELAIDYHRRGAVDDAVAILEIGEGVTTNPLLRAWRAWLRDEPSYLRGGADLAFVFPYRRETLAVLAWAARQNDHWSWTYLHGLNLWARDREREAAEAWEGLADRPDFAPAYVARGRLRERVRGADPETDLRRAVALGAENRTIRIHLIRFLQQRARWEEALAESAAGRARFPDDFNLDLLHVRSLNHLGRAAEAIAILDATRVLPSENSGESHRLYEQAHLLAALDALDVGDLEAARTHGEAALRWPEHLGQGRPYVPEERLGQFLLGTIARRGGDAEGARRRFETVARATDLGDVRDRLDLLGVAATAAAGRADTLWMIPLGGAGDVARLAGELVPALSRGEPRRGTVERLARRYPDLFVDLEGRLLLRALTASP